MADGYALALQKGLIATLKADAGVSALVGARIYDKPPQSATRPFIRIGGIEPRPLRTDGKAAATVVFSLEAHSRSNSGRVEATQCAEAIVAALDEVAVDLNADGYETTILQWQGQTVAEDDDNEGFLAITVFNGLLDG